MTFLTSILSDIPDHECTVSPGTKSKLTSRFCWQTNRDWINNQSRSILRGMGGGLGLLALSFEGSTSEEPLISFWPVWMSRALAVISSMEASATATDCLPENEGETRCSPWSSLQPGLGFGSGGRWRFMSILFGASSLAAFVEWSFGDPASMSVLEDLDFDRGGATGFSAVTGTLSSLLESISTTNERGLGLGVGLETDATLGRGASWSSEFVAFALQPQRTGAEHSSDSCDVTLKSFNDNPLTPFLPKRDKRNKFSTKEKNELNASTAIQLRREI